MQIGLRPSHERVNYKGKEPHPREMTWVLPIINGESELIPANSSAPRRLRRILGELKNADKIRSELALNLEKARRKGQIAGPPDEVFFRDQHLGELSRLQGQLRKVNALLRRYTRSPTIVVGHRYRMSELAHWKLPKRHEVYEEWEHFGLEMILEATRDGALSRYRQCDQCERWFYAATPRQRFCKDSCRKRYASKSEEYRAKRRVYMRHYRKDERTLSENAKKNVKKLAKR
jgi:hypothetical protein